MKKPVLVIMAAGMGSRYGGLKQIDPIGPNGQILLDYSIYDAHRAGFDRVVFIIRPELHEAFEQAIGAKARRFMQVDYAYQTLDRLPEGLKAPEGREKPLGTAHAVWCAKELTEGCPIAVINADDFYGADAYRTIYAELQRLPETGAAAMVGYLLKNTVTAHGTVSRGVCHVKDGYLSDIRETLKIALLPDGTIRDEDTGAVLDGDTVVSMNFWGFMPSIFPALRNYFEDFLRNEAGDNIKAECLLPVFVDELMHEGELTVPMLTTDAVWFGVTYKEDKPFVQAELRKLHESGVYPASLHE